jgi:hypothetical protein
MTSPTHDHTTSTPPTPTDTDRVRRSAAARVADALTRLDHAFLALGRCPTGDDAGWAAYSAAMALMALPSLRTVDPGRERLRRLSPED